MRKILIITLLIFFILIILNYNKKENATNITEADSEAIQNISSLYNTLEKPAVFNNITTTGNATIKGNTIIDGTLNLSGTNVYGYLVPKGGIIMWSGTIEEIPNGWTLCDGKVINGKQIPDLRGRFIVGYEPRTKDNNNIYDNYANNIGATGGSKQLYSLVGFKQNEDTGSMIGFRYLAGEDSNIKKTLTNAIENRKLNDFAQYKLDRQMSTQALPTDIKFPISSTVELRGIFHVAKIFETDMWDHPASQRVKPVYVMGDADERTTLPPYYVLAYIMKL